MYVKMRMYMSECYVHACVCVYIYAQTFSSCNVIQHSSRQDSTIHNTSNNNRKTIQNHNNHAICAKAATRVQGLHDANKSTQKASSPPFERPHIVAERGPAKTIRSFGTSALWCNPSVPHDLLKRFMVQIW